MTMWLVLLMAASCAVARPQEEQWQPLPVLSSPPEQPAKSSTSSSAYTERVIASLHNRHKLKHPANGVLPQHSGKLEEKTKVTLESHASESLDELILQHAPIDNGGGTVGYVKQPVNVEDVRWEHVNHDQHSSDHDHGSHHEDWDHESSHNGGGWNHDIYHRPPHVILVEDVKPPYHYTKPIQTTSHWSNYDSPAPTYEHHRPEATTQYYTLLTVKPLEHTTTAPQTTKPYPHIVIINHYPTKQPPTTTYRPYYPPHTYPSTHPADVVSTTAPITTTTTRRPTTTRPPTTTSQRPTSTARPKPTTIRPTLPTATFWPYYTTTPSSVEPNRCGNINITSVINNNYVGNSSKQAISCPDVNILIANLNQNVKDASTTTARPLGDDPVDEEDEDEVGEEEEGGVDVDNGGGGDSGEGGGGGNPMVPIINFLIGFNPLSYGFWSFVLAPVALFMGMMALFTPYVLWKRSYHSHPMKAVSYHKHHHKTEEFHDHHAKEHHESKGYAEHEYLPYFNRHSKSQPSYYSRRKVHRRSVTLDEAEAAVMNAIDAVEERLMANSRRNYRT